jgi:hypothetical protein
VSSQSIESVARDSQHRTYSECLSNFGDVKGSIMMGTSVVKQAKDKGQKIQLDLIDAIGDFIEHPSGVIQVFEVY